MKSVILAIVLSGAVSSGAAAPSNALLNGSFESSAMDAPTRVDIALLTDWETEGGYMMLERGVNGDSNVAAHTGEQFVSMGHSGAMGDRLWQSFTTGAGGVYEVSFATRSIQGSVTQALFVSITDDATDGELASAVVMEMPFEDGWTEHAFSFTAVSNSTTIRFLHATGSHQANVALDSVVVLIPAPPVLALLGLGLVCTRRR